MAKHTYTNKKYKCTVAYDGTNYAGFQIQQNAYTIQEALEQALSRIHYQEIKIFASGRTDAGVHARGQVFHFESALDIQVNNWTRVINTKLTPDIRVLETVEVHPEFHARYDATKKEYRYFIKVAAIEDPLRRLYVHQIHHPLDIKKMKKAAVHLLGEHDFTAFSSAKTEKEVKVRTIYKFDFVCKGDELMIICEGNGFLHHMMRIIVGTLIDVGRGKIDTSQVKLALCQHDRNLTGKTAPAHGLYLWKVTYPT